MLNIGDFLNGQPIVKIEQDEVHGTRYITSISERFYHCVDCGCIVQEGYSCKPDKYVCHQCVPEIEPVCSENW